MKKLKCIKCGERRDGNDMIVVVYNSGKFNYCPECVPAQRACGRDSRPPEIDLPKHGGPLPL